EPAADVALGDGHDKSKIGLEQFTLDFEQTVLVRLNARETPLEQTHRHAKFWLKRLALVCANVGRLRIEGAELLIEMRQLDDDVIDNGWTNRQCAEDVRDFRG